MKLKTVFCSSLAKVLPSAGPEIEIRRGCTLRGERFSFQLAYRVTDAWRGQLEVRAESPFGNALRIRKAGLVPVEYTGIVFDDDIISREPGLYPDVLSDLDGEGAPALPSWQSLWFTVDVPADFPAGVHEIRIHLRAVWPHQPVPDETDCGIKTFRLEVLDAVLPEQKLKNTHWFHCDCLADYYGVPVFSEEHWRIIGNFMKNAAAHGINMILTPVFTPPLDTAVGSERPTVQLVKVKRTRGRKYTFDFSLLERWIALAQKCGIRYFEISHLFTQWGARFTPKIVAEVNGKEKRIFGWDVEAGSPEYRRFLDAFLPELAAFLKKKKLQKRTYFHCSDEPYEAHLDQYKADKAIMTKHLSGFRIMDALSHVEYYREGIVTTPVPSEAHLEEFLAAGMKERWTYYCCGPVTVYSNRFIHMPSSRNRIFGTLLYLYGIEGFLHWGFNFYYSGHSRFPIDPYRCNHAGYFFPAGDPFVVYPGKNGVPEDSIRHEVFYEGLQDQRALEKLESLIGREKVLKELDRCAPGGKMKIDRYPKGEKAVSALRGKVNSLIRKALETNRQHPDNHNTKGGMRCRNSK
ncbi:MAG: DUF4091 domain-containing protein [Lentisphaeria bacterium]|nr:DUF4091 domain-containing protein [Lentisphaeria bacterium]